MSFLLVALVALTGCVTSGTYFGSDTHWIKSNKTTQEDVRRLLGNPFMVGNSGGSPTWTYGYYRYKLVGESFTKELKFYWNADRTVQSYSFNSSFPEDTGATNPKTAPGIVKQPEVKYP
jgi:outer membrane protein assembly factor BamE (lipoprotein component of BamABCDE complex)